MCKVDPISVLRHGLHSVAILLLLSGLQSACAEEPSWRLVYSSDFHGELRPCGCSKEGDLGGVLRRASRFSQLRQQDVATIFVSAGDILGSRDEQANIKSRYMLAAHASFGLDAILPGERELAYSVDKLTAQPLPWVLTNQTGDYPFPLQQEKLLAGRRLLIFGLLDPQLLNDHQNNRLTKMKPALDENLRRQKVSKRDIVIVLLHADEARLKQFAHHPLIDVIVRGHLKRPVRQSSPVAAAFSAGYQGQRIGIAEFLLGDTIRLMQNRIEPLARDVPDDPAMARLYAEYDQAIGEWYENKIAARRGIQNALSPYATVKVCAGCHVETAARWRKTRHANALETLAKAGKDTDPECLACHNTGFGETGGFLSPKATPALANVQCEACHGAARGHAAYPLAVKPQKAWGTCINCHTIESSPSFAIDRYWPRIIHQKVAGIARHRQAFSAVQGEYTLLEKNREVIGAGPIVISEYFNFYCNRCYILDKEWYRLTSLLDKPFIHKEIPITFGKQQQPLAALAYLAAVKAGKGKEFKTAVFAAKFEQDADIDKKQTLIAIAAKLGFAPAVRRVLQQKDTPEAKTFLQGMTKKDQLNITATPTLLINGNLSVSPKNTGDNLNLMVENLEEILLDVQCLQQGRCKGD